MEDSKELPYIYKRKPVHLDKESADDKFDVIVPRKNLILLIAIFAALFFLQFYYFSGMYLQVMYPEEYDPEAGFYWWAPLVFLAIVIVPVLAWGEFGSRLASTSIIKYLRKTIKKKIPGPSEIVMGFPLRTKDIYYLEAYPVDLDLGSDFTHTKVFIKRVLEVLFLSMGMSVTISQIVAPFLYSPVITTYPDMYWNIEEMIIDLTIYLGPFSLLILTFIMPVFWISEDLQAYRVNEYQDAVRLGYYLRTGLLSKILGFFGIILVFNLAQEFATVLLLGTEELEYSELMSSPELAFQLYYTVAIWFGLIVGMSAGTPFLVTLLYLSFYHSRWVNNVRIKASEFMPLGTMEIEKPKTTNLRYLTHPEMIDESGGFFQTPLGKIILIILIAIAGGICIYLAFILGFEEALFPS